MRRTSTLLMVFVWVLVVGCGDDDSVGPDAAGQPDAAATADANTSAVRVVVLLDGHGRGDLSFNDMAGAGVDQARSIYPNLEVIEIVADTTDDPVGDAIAQQPDLIIGIGFPFFDLIAEASVTNPDIHFATIDFAVESANAAGLVFAEEQGSFLVGVAAGLKSTTGTYGFLGGLDIPLINKFRAGWVAGVQHVDPDAVFINEYAPDPSNPFGDYEGGKMVATEMYVAGADMVYGAAGFTGVGIFPAAQEYSAANATQVWGIGVDSDMYNLLPENEQPYILTSMLKRVDVAVLAIISDEVAGTFQGGLHYFDLSLDGVGYSVTGGNLDDIVATLESVKQDIIDGTIIVPTEP